MEITADEILPDVKIIKPSVFEDHRGHNVTAFYEKDYASLKLNFIQDNYSMSRKNVIRGIHGDYETWKLVYCAFGELYLIVVDMRPDSLTFMKHTEHILTSSNKQVLIPPGVGNGFVVLSNESVFSYKWSYDGEYPDENEQFSIKWDDPLIGIDWPMDNPILSKRDKSS